MQNRPSTVLGGGDYSPELISALVRATEAAAEASRAWIGRGDKNAADAAAVAAMRANLADAPFDGTVVIGEGEKDAAPMLANGERLGAGGTAYDIAVDPLDGTRLVAEGIPGSISVIALAPRNTMFDPAAVFYMDKLICPSAGEGVVDIRMPVGENLAAFAAATRRPIGDLVVAVLEKPRHVNLVAEIRATGATVQLLGEGDIVAAVRAAQGELDFVLGVGGTPEGVIAACAVRALGAFMQGRLAAGHTHERVLELDDLVASNRVLYVSSAV